jgi:hypothetical protein
MNIHGLYFGICNQYNGAGQRRGSVIGFNEWANRLKELAAFMPMAVHNDAAGAAVMSGERMTVELMTVQPTVADFLDDPATVLWMLVVRALHRHVNHSVFATFDLRNTPNVGDTNPNTVRVPVVNGNRFDKGVMSREGNLWLLLKNLSEYTYAQIRLIDSFQDDSYGDEAAVINIANAAMNITESLKSNTMTVRMYEKKTAANYCALVMLTRSIMVMIDEFPGQRKRMQQNTQYVDYVMNAGQAVIDMLTGPGINTKTNPAKIRSKPLADLVDTTMQYRFERIDQM